MSSTSDHEAVVMSEDDAPIDVANEAADRDEGSNGEDVQVVEAAVIVDEEEGAQEAEDIENAQESEAQADAVVQTDDQEADAVDAVAEDAVDVAQPGETQVVEHGESEEPAGVRTTPKRSPRKPTKTASTGKAKEKRPKRKKSRRSEGPAQGISADRLHAANAAREMLLQMVPILPIPVHESFVVRSFGQLHVEAADKFSTASALYPVGFCCDRFEFSPVHGRVIKLRCAIIDGKRTSLDHDGPIFRVMWGQGVDEDVDQVEYPYDPYAASAPITGNGVDDVVAIPAAPGLASELTLPSKGMRVKVRFDRDEFYYGTIESVEEPEGADKKKKRKEVSIVIEYDDGSTEEAVYPDADISLVMPGT